MLQRRRKKCAKGSKKGAGIPLHGHFGSKDLELRQEHITSTYTEAPESCKLLIMSSAVERARKAACVLAPFDSIVCVSIT